MGKKRQEFLERLMNAYTKDWEALLVKQMQEALSGNQQACRLIFEHLLPKQLAMMPGEEEREITLDHLKTDQDRAEARRIAEQAEADIRNLGKQA